MALTHQQARDRAERIRALHGEGMTLAQIAARFKLTRERCRQIVCGIDTNLRRAQGKQ